MTSSKSTSLLSTRQRVGRWAFSGTWLLLALVLVCIWLNSDLPLFVRLMYSLPALAAGVLLVFIWLWLSLSKTGRIWSLVVFLVLAGLGGWYGYAWVAVPEVMEAELPPRPPDPTVPWFCDLEPHPLPRIPPGTVVGAEPPPGWSHVVLRLRGRFKPDGKTNLPAAMVEAANTFTCCVLARTQRPEVGAAVQGDQLEQVATAFSIEGPDGDRIVSSSVVEDRNQLGWMKTIALRAAENDLTRQVIRARTPNLWIFDVPFQMWHEGQGVQMVRRYVVMVSRRDKKLVSLFWDRDAAPNEHQLADPTAVYLLPPALIDEVPFGIIQASIITPNVFAPQRRPKSTAITLPAAWRPELDQTPLTEEAVRRLEQDLAQRYGLVIASPAR